jgi:hypothetical protein
MMAEIIDDMRTFTITLTAPATATPTTTPDSTAPPGSFQWIADKYDRNLSRRIEDDEMGPAYNDYRSGAISAANYSAVANANTRSSYLPLASGVVSASSTTTCNTPTVTYVTTPNITISGDTASCRVSINTGDGSKLDPTTSTVELWDGETWVPNAISKFDPNAPVQTRTITWPLKKTSDAIHAMIYIKNACGKETDWVRSEPANYVRPGGEPAKGTIVSIDAPASVVVGSTVSVTCTIKNIGGSTGRFRIDLFRLDDDGDHISHGSIGSTTLEVGRSYTPTATRFQVPFSGTSAKYEVRCVRLT